ncbi:hypothetical protein [Mucilaginibacter ginsenosidivorans]|uniref:MipA/OmpV family protein n=1 Tax=Mucilaginibacter ginsenosidivorans TaxID=398053 RepID=A0A5B8UQB2_9SPHI|nr:hypothetical protein [Mucilaginibacter ginsenosidivorans]QEC61280.1 hypothetical protein FRZ54_01345 [Mucilaginibacter ginsenosidivorans]
MKYACPLLLFSIFISMHVNAGTYRNYADTVPKKSADTDTVVRKQSLSVGVSFGSDAQFFGRTGTQKYPFMNSDIIYNAKSGFFVYGSFYKVFTSTPVIDETDAGGGYFYRFSPKFTGNISYTRFIFNKDALIIKSASSNDINFNNSYDWKIMKTGVVLDYLFGQSSDFFMTINNSKYFESNFGIFDDKDYLSFNPGFTIILGTQNFVQKYSQNHPGKFDLDDPYLPPPLHSYSGYNSEFKMLNYSLKLPIAYNRPHYTFEFAYKYSIPVNVEGILKNHRESFFNLTFYYLFY